jgi:MFS family permease
MQMTALKQKRNRRLLLLGTNFISVFGWSLMVPLYALYISSVGGDAQVAALVWSFYTLLSGVLIVALGWLQGRIKYKSKVILLGYILQAAGTVALFLANDYTMVIVGLSIYAVGSGFVMPAWKHAFATAKKGEDQAAEWGLFDGGNMLLISAAAAASSALYGLYGFRGIMGLMMASHILAVFTAIYLVRNHDF